MWLGMAVLAARGRPPPHLPHKCPQVHISICIAAADSVVSWLFHSTSHLHNPNAQFMNAVLPIHNVGGPLMSA